MTAPAEIYGSVMAQDNPQPSQPTYPTHQFKWIGLGPIRIHEPIQRIWWLNIFIL